MPDQRPQASALATTPAPAGAAAARTRLPSIRLRLTVWMVVIALVIQLTLGLVVFLYQAAALNGLFDERIRERTELLARDVESTTIKIVQPTLLAFARERIGFPTEEPRAIALFDSLGVPTAGDNAVAIPPEVFPGARLHATPEGAIVCYSINTPNAKSPWRFIVRRLTDAEGAVAYLVVGRPDTTYHSMLALIRRILFLSLPVGVIGAGVAGWLISGIALAPVKRLRDVAHALDPETIQQEVPVNVGGVAELEDVQVIIEDVRERLRLAFGARDRFISNVSHELKTPIAIILTEAQTLDARSLSPEARVFVRSVIDEMRRLSRTIESFLTLTKVRAGKSLMEQSPCEVAEFVMDAVLGCSRLARQHGVTLNPLLADTDQPLLVTGDCELLRVLVDNLLRNAIRFSPENTQVIVHVTESASECIIAVRDFGPGIAHEIIGSVFEPIPTPNGTAHAGRGAGLGLAIAQTIAQLHAGSITAHNLPDAGCEFVVRIPRDPAAAAAR